MNVNEQYFSLFDDDEFKRARQCARSVVDDFSLGDDSRAVELAMAVLSSHCLDAKAKIRFLEDNTNFKPPKSSLFLDMLSPDKNPSVVDALASGPVGLASLLPFIHEASESMMVACGVLEDRINDGSESF